MGAFRTTYSHAPQAVTGGRREPVRSVAVKAEPRTIVSAASRQGRRTDSQQVGYVHGAKAYATAILGLAEDGKLTEADCQSLLFVKVNYGLKTPPGVAHLPLPKASGFLRVGPALAVQERDYGLAVYMWALPAKK